MARTVGALVPKTGDGRYPVLVRSIPSVTAKPLACGHTFRGLSDPFRPSMLDALGPPRATGVSPLQFGTTQRVSPQAVLPVPPGPTLCSAPQEYVV